MSALASPTSKPGTGAVSGNSHPLSALTGLGVVMLALSACQTPPTSTAGVVPPAVYASGGAGTHVSVLPNWFTRTNESFLSDDESYLREHAFDIAAPADEHISFWARPKYMTESTIHVGPPMAPQQEYYMASSHMHPASEAARINILLADLQRANARLDIYLGIAERVFIQEDARMAAILDADLNTDLNDEYDLTALLRHTLENRKAIAIVLESLPHRIASYAYAAKRAHIDLPGAPGLYNIEAEIARLSHATSILATRLEGLDLKITDLMAISSGPSSEG